MANTQTATATATSTSKVTKAVLESLLSEQEQKTADVEKLLAERNAKIDELKSYIDQLHDRMGNVQIILDEDGIHYRTRGQVGQNLSKAVDAERLKNEDPETKLSKAADRLKADIMSVIFNHFEPGQQEQYEDLQGMERTSGRMSASSLSKVSVAAKIEK